MAYRKKFQLLSSIDEFDCYREIALRGEPSGSFRPDGLGNIYSSTDKSGYRIELAGAHGIGGWEWFRIDTGNLVCFVDVQFNQDIEQHISVQEHAHVQFFITRGAGFGWKNELASQGYSRAISVFTMTYPANSEITRRVPARARNCGVSLLFKLSALENMCGGPFNESINTFLQLLSNNELVITHRFYMPAIATVYDQFVDCAYTGLMRDAYRKAKAVELSCLLIESISRGDIQKERFGQTSESRLRVERALEIMTENIDKKITMEQLAERLGVTSRTLMRDANQVLGISLSEFHRERRLQVACDLLEAEDTPITEIAFRTGFQRVSNFSEAFSVRFGVTPRIYRALHKGVLPEIGVTKRQLRKAKK